MTPHRMKALAHGRAPGTRRAESSWRPLVASALFLASCSLFKQEQPLQTGLQPAEPRLTFQATAYSIEGKTASGTAAHEGLVAADPHILPLGSRIRVEDAGAYSGEYVVKDTGRAIDGHELDIYLASDSEAKKFGKQTVKVLVLQYGDGSRDGARREPLPVDAAKAPALR